jgi:hypothetical protein
MGRVMDRVKQYIDMEARYRKQADAEPDRRERHIADANAWRLLAVTRSFVIAKQTETRGLIPPVGILESRR